MRIRRLNPRWDELDIELSVLDRATRQRPRPLHEIGEVPKEPGVYFVFYRGGLHTYAPASAAGYPLYVGAATVLDERLARHRHNTDPVANLRGGQDLLATAVPLRSHAAALYLETLLIDRLQPCWNQRPFRGFGSRQQGPTRSQQSPPPWALLHPGRRVGTGKPATDANVLWAQIAQHVRQTVRPGLFVPEKAA